MAPSEILLHYGIMMEDSNWDMGDIEIIADSFKSKLREVCISEGSMPRDFARYAWMVFACDLIDTEGVEGAKALINRICGD
jgi:hypothetical protein